MKRPSLLIKPIAYKTDKLYAILPQNGNGDMSVTNSFTTGRRQDPQGFNKSVAADTPRIDYQFAPGLLLEPARTNEALWSANPNDATWTKSNITVTDNDTNVPTGDIGGDRISDDSDTTAGYLSQSVTLATAGGGYTASVFIKFGDRSDIGMRVYTNGVTGYNADLILSDDGTITVNADTNSIIIDTFVEKFPDGWIRFGASINAAVGGNDTAIDFRVYPGTSFPEDVDGHGYCWVWGYQLEDGSFPSSYINTTTTTQTRSADKLDLSSIITNGLIGESNGSFFVDVEIPYVKADAQNTIAGIGGAGGQVALVSQITSETNRAYAYVQNTDLTTDTYDISDRRIKVLFNLFGDTTEVWVNGTKVLQTGADMFLSAGELDFGQSGQKAILYECAMYYKTLNDTESKAITQ